MNRSLFFQRTRGRPAGQRGQTMVLVALLLVFLLLALGLTLDVVRLYILVVQSARAAESGALAGALYMPNYYDMTSPAPDGNYAVMRVCAAVKQNGIANCPVGAGQVGATPSPVPGYPYRLQVTVTQSADLFFLSLLMPNVNTATVSRTATAEFLPPINQGITHQRYGDEDDDDEDHGAQPQQWYWAHINGPQEVKENGDAYTPLYEEGPTNPVTAPDTLGSTPYQLNRFPAQLASQTNHPQYASGAITNPDTQKAGFVGAGGTLGYDYQIVIQPGTALPINLEVFNLPFVAGNMTAGTHPISESLGSACLDPKFQVGGVCATDSPDAYMHLDYSVYSVQLGFERSEDVLLNGPSGYSPDPLDLLPADLSKHACAVGIQAYDLTVQACVALPPTLDNWTILYTFTAPGTYRLSVEATAGYGLHNYGLQLTDAMRNPVTTGASLWWWNTMCISFNATTTTTALFGIGVVPAAYAGHMLNFDFFNLGVSSGTTYVELLDPSNTPVPFPAWVTTVTGSGGTMIDASNGRYHGEWVKIPVQIPTTYNPTPGKGWWSLRFTSPAGNLSTVMTVTIDLGLTPIHLVP